MNPESLTKSQDVSGFGAWGLGLKTRIPTSPKPVDRRMGYRHLLEKLPAAGHYQSSAHPSH